MGMRRHEHRRCIVAGRGALAEAIAERLRQEDGTVVLLPQHAATLATDEGAAAAVASAVDELGGLDVCATAFASRTDVSFLEIDDEQWVRCIDENLTCAFTVAREAARAMLARSGGVIVHVGSDVAARPGSGSSAYAAAKAGLQLMSTSMALDLSLDGVRVCAVAAPEDGAGTPHGEQLGPADTAAAVAFCASDEASYVLGSTFFLNGPLPVRG
jgi:NAD(P)-dependent dehydrogenase (short-subunit alcohol dehydrogenase family)